MKLKRLRAAIAEQVEGHFGQPEKKGQHRAEEGLYELCSYYQCTLFERSPLWYLVHNQMIQKKRFPAGLRYRYLLWRIWLVPPYALVNMLSLSSRAGEPMRKNANKHIYLKKSCAFTIFPDEMCKWRQIRFPPTSALVNLFWQVVVGWRENLLCKLFVTLCVHQMVLQKTTNGGKFVTSCLAVTWERSCHSGDNASQIVRFSRKGLTPCFVGTNFSPACVSPSWGKCLGTSNWCHGSQN